MKQWKNFKRVKVGIIPVIVSLVLVFSWGLLVATDVDHEEESRLAPENMALLYEVWEILDEKFLDTKEEKEKEKVTDQERIWGAIGGLASSYGDPYTVFLPPQESEDLLADISGEFGGVGVEIENKGGLLTVVSPLPGTPAARAGLMPKDIIIKIDDTDSIDFSSSAAAQLIRGEAGTIVTLQVIRSGEVDPLDIEVERAIIQIPTVKTYNKDGVFVIKLFSFTQNSHELFFDAVKEFAETKNTRLIIDLRGNTGGHLFAAVYIAGLFLPEGSQVVTEDYGDKKESDVLLSGEFHENDRTVDIFSDRVKVGVLVDKGSASASEILAGALHDNDRAVLLGQDTYGKGTVQQVVQLEDGTSLKYTIARWILPDGSWITHDGIPVDIKIDMTREEFIESRQGGQYSGEIDAQMQRAIDEMLKIKTQDDIKKLIEQTRQEQQKEVAEEREKKIQEILDR